MTNLYLPSLQLARHSNCVSSTRYDDDYDDHGRADDEKIMVIIFMCMAGESEDLYFLEVFVS